MADNATNVTTKSLVVRSLELQGILDRVMACLADSKVSVGMTFLFEQLEKLRCESSPDEWLNLVSIGQLHHLCNVLQECPLTSHSFVRPRGYPGDAALLDYIYYGSEDKCNFSNDTTDCGRAIFRWLVTTRAARAVQARREYIAAEIDSLKDTHATILSVAAGHCREIDICRTLSLANSRSLTALDQDADSIAEIKRAYHGQRISTEVDSVLSLLRRGKHPGPYDLIYSLGLYDYLPDRLANRLTTALFKRLNPAGRLIIANFVPGIPDRGFMEMYLRWNLIYRDQTQLKQVSSAISLGQLAAVSSSTIADGCISILKLDRT